MKGEQADKLVAQCAKIASKAPKIVAYIMIYETKNGVIHTQRSGSAMAQLGLAKLAESNVLRCLVPKE